MNAPAASPAHPPDCLKCLNFFVSWDPAFPRGCRLFEVKCRDLPSLSIYRATGRHCPSFVKSARLKKEKRGCG